MELVITRTAETDRRNMIKSVLTHGGKIFIKGIVGRMLLSPNQHLLAYM